MKIFIKKLLIPLFLTAAGDWTPDNDAALEFDSGSDAIEYSHKHQVRKAQVYYHFENPSFDFAVSTAGPVAANVVAGIWGHDDPVQLQQIADAAGRGDLVIPVAHVFPLAQLAEAHKALAASPRGKVIVTH